MGFSMNFEMFLYLYMHGITYTIEIFLTVIYNFIDNYINNTLIINTGNNSMILKDHDKADYNLKMRVFYFILKGGIRAMSAGQRQDKN